MPVRIRAGQVLWLPFVCARKPHERSAGVLGDSSDLLAGEGIWKGGERGVWVMQHAYSYTLRFIVFALHFRSILYFICFVHVRSTYDFSAISLFALYGPRGAEIL